MQIYLFTSQAYFGFYAPRAYFNAADYDFADNFTNRNDVLKTESVNDSANLFATYECDAVANGEFFGETRIPSASFVARVPAPLCNYKNFIRAYESSALR